MPVILRYKGYRFFFYSNEGNPREPLHIHVRKGSHVAKFWIKPQVTLAESYGFLSSELKKFAAIIGKNKNKIERSWNEYFNH